jgi:hypothetical protein
MGILADVTQPFILKVIAASFSLGSGVITLLSQQIYKDSDVLNLWTGANGYLDLREQAKRTLLQLAELNSQEKLARIEDLQTAYAELDAKFGQYVGPYGELSLRGIYFPHTTHLT